MKTQRMLLAISLLALCGQSSYGSAADIEINEVVSSNNATIADENGDYSDWIELHNTGTTPVDLTGWGLTDLPATPFKWVFPARTLLPDAYLLVWASSKDRAAATGPLHTNFAVSASGESLALTEPTGTTVDLVAVPTLPANVSYGRKPGQGDSLFYFETPTPMVANSTPGYPDLTIPPTFTQPGGFYTSAFSLGISAQPGWTIYYTKDGSDPDPSRVGSGAKPYRVTHAYDGPIPVASRTGDSNIFSMIKTTGVVKSWATEWQAPAGEVFKATVIRAIARDPLTGRTSRAITRTYFVDPAIHGRYGHLPVVSVVSDYINLFDNATGIYVPGVTHGGDYSKQNFVQDWSRPASVEYFESDGTPAFNGDYEISNQGSTSPGNPQKALNVIARAELGPEMINYPVFAGTDFKASQQTSFKRINLRAWGSSVNWQVLFTDAFHQELGATADQETEAYVPAIVFINGEYWGLHDIREHNKNSWYHQGRTGINRDDPGYDLLEGSGAIIDEGDAVHWNETMAYIDSHDLANDAYYDYITNRIDVANFAEYVVHCCYTGKRTWPDQNEAKWRPRTADGKWRWTQFDMDQGLSEFGAPEHDMIIQVMNGYTDYGPHPLLVKLMKNSRFKSLFIDTYADWLNSRVLRSVELALFDAMKAELNPFIAEYDLRWPSAHRWADTGYGRDIVSRRNGIRRNQLRNFFTLGSDRTITLQTDPTQGVIRCNRIVVDSNTPGASNPPYPWTGIYFHYEPVTLEAMPRDGYKFIGWHVKVGGVDLPPIGANPAYYSQEPVIKLSLDAASSSILTSAEAVFEIIPTADLHTWTFEGGTDPYPPTFTVGGGTLSVTPSLNTSVSTASQGFLTSHLRVNNPIGSIVQWALPTTGYQSPKLGFLTRRSGSGAGTQTLSYTLDGTSWTELSSYSVNDADPQAKSFSFSGIPAASDNPNFAVRIEFTQGSGGTSGNNRFDDVVLNGVVLPRSFTATIESSLAAAVNISVSPTDNNGQSNGVTGFTRSYLENSMITLTAPTTSGGYQFQKWQKDGTVLATSPAINVTMDNHHTFTAVYIEVVPTISLQPKNIAVAAGDSATFQVTATGTGTLHYQWRFNGTDIPNSDASSYTIASVTPDNIGTYDVVVSNAAGPITSNPASLTIVTTALVNGSFESDYTGWTHTGNQLVLLLPVADPYVASDGVKIVVFNKSNTTPNAVLSQSFATTPGQLYQLTFNMGILAYNDFQQRLRVDLNGSSLLLSQTFTMVRSGGNAFRTEAKSMSFTANSPTTTLTFRDLSPASDSLNMTLDNVRVSSSAPPANRAPVAVAESYSTIQNTPLTVPAPGVLGNDSDPDANPLTAVLNAGPSHGLLALNPNGSFTYTPTGGYSGGDSFTYHANDGSLDSNIVTVALTVNPPVSSSLVNGSFESEFTGWTHTGNQVVLQLPVADPYVASDGVKIVVFNKSNTTPNAVLSQSFATTPGQLYQLTFNMGILAYNDFQQRLQVDLNGSSLLLSQTFSMVRSGGTAFRTEAKSMSFTANGPTTTLTFRDLSTATNAINLSLDHVRINSTTPPANQAPVSVADSYTTTKDTPLSVPSPGVLGNDSDPDANPLTAVLNAGPGHGLLTLNPNGSFTYTPTTGYTGVDSFTYHATDGTLNSNIVAVNITMIAGHQAIYAHYRMGDGSPSTNGGRNLPYDASGNGHHMVNAAAGTPAIFNNGGPNNDAFYTFSGDNQFYTAAGGGWDPPEDNVGVEVWVRTTGLVQLDSHVFGTGNNTSGLNIGYDATGGRGWFGAVAGKQLAGFVGSANYASNTWIHLAVVREAGTTTFFVNGNVSGISTAVPNNATGSEALRMAVNSDGINPFLGDIAEARVFTFAAGSFSPSTDLLFAPAPQAVVRELSIPTIIGNSYLARFSILPNSGGTVVPRLNLSITGSTTLREVALRKSLPVAADSVPYIYKFTADSTTTTLRFTTLDGDTATAAQVADLQVAEPLTLMPSTTPNEFQQAQIDRRYGLFLHFGINTFTGNEWGSGAESPSIYQPTSLDVDQWVRTASEAGMRYVLVISKHHDGFCMWDSRWTTHDVGSSPVKDDILAAAARACRKYGVRLAIYYSLWDRHEPTYTYPGDDDYNQYMQRQLSELMENYGPVCELWLDGAWDKENTRWPSFELYDLVRRLQPDCQVSTNWTIGYPWNPDANLVLPVNQEQGYPIRYFPSDFRLGDPYLPKNPDPKFFSNNGNSYYLPFEATITLSSSNNWFHHPDDVNDKSVSELAALYGQATSQNNILVLNAPPDRSGRVRDLERSTLFQLRDQLGLTSGLSLPHGGTARSVPGKIEAEDFDVGGPEVAYHDLTPSNTGGLYRSGDGVDIETTSDSDGGYRVTGTEAGEWLKYTITVGVPGNYTLTLRTANATAGGQVKVEIDGIEVSGPMTIPQTGGMDSWQSIETSGIHLGVGEHLLRLVMVQNASDGAVGAFNWLSLTSESTAPNAAADSYSTPRDTPLSVSSPGILGNDSDSNADPLTALLNVGPSHGLLALNPNGSFTYTPSAGYTGTDSFTYHANDGRLDSNVATVSLTINPVVSTTLVNGSFESDYTGWTHTGNQLILRLPVSDPYVASDGSKLVVFNKGNTTPNAVLSQTFTTTPGQLYQLSFNMGILAYNDFQQRLRVDLNGSSLLLSQTFTMVRAGGSAFRTEAKSMSFTANSNTTTLTFRDLSPASDSLNMTLDNVRVNGSSLAAPAVASSAIGAATVPPPEPNLLEAPMLSGSLGDYTIRLNAERAGTYVLERSDNLRTWENISTMQVTDPGLIEFHDTSSPVFPEPPPARRFYRIGRLLDTPTNH